MAAVVATVALAGCSFIQKGRLHRGWYETNIQPIWDSHCILCHHEGASLNLKRPPVSSYNSLYKQPAQFSLDKSAKRVEPYDAEGSVLYERIFDITPPSEIGNPQWQRMPPPGKGNLTPDEKDLITKWIDREANYNILSGPQ